MTRSPVHTAGSTPAVLLAVALMSTLVFSGQSARATHGIPSGGGGGIVYVHWPAFSWGQQVTMVDRTYPWPVTTATSNWDRSDALIDSGLVHYHWWECSHAVNCTIINEINDPNAAWIGATGLSWNAAGHLNQNTVIYLNNYYVPAGCGGETAANCRRHTACQEIGHALGLDHQTGPSCMDDTDFSKLTPEYQNSGHDDHDQLHTAYDHGYHG